VKSAFLSLLVLVVAQPGVAAAQGHLEPEDGAFASVLPEYYAKARNTLLTGVPGQSMTAVVLPSFEPEWSVWVIQRPEPVACSRTAVAPIWNEEKPAEPDAPSVPQAPKCAPLSADLAADLVDVWTAMLRPVRYPAPPKKILVDGTSYHFVGFDQGQILAGQISSPESNVPTGRLVATVEALRAFTTTPSRESAEAVCRASAAVRPDGRRLTSRCSRR
jgi:hypothetical protein